jgi:hypothetical protein
MKGLVELSGTSCSEKVTVYIDGRYSDGSVYEFKPCMESLKEDGYDCLIYMTPESKHIRLSYGFLRSEGESYVWVLITNPFTKFKQEDLQSNVPIKYTYSFNLLEWGLFGVNKVLRKIKEVVCGKC